jgi:hypothetical protein
MNRQVGKSWGVIPWEDCLLLLQSRGFQLLTQPVATRRR